VPSSSRHYLSGMLAEFTRAIAAAHRYEDLRYRSARRGTIAPDEIPRQIFEEFYSVTEAVELRPPVSRQTDSPKPRYRTAKAPS
jgi:hypothetical protein